MIKTTFLISLLLLPTLSFSIEKTERVLGNEKGNGGDSCEQMIKEISTDIRKWIQSEDYKGLKFPSSLSEKDYRDKMLDAIAKTTISCTTKTLFYGNTEKTCINVKNHMTCDFQRFMDSSSTNQYKLIHHEYAGVAGIETNKDDNSQYFLTNQLSDFLRETYTYKLGIKSNTSSIIKEVRYNNEFLNQKQNCQWAKTLAAHRAISTCYENILTCYEKHQTLVKVGNQECVAKHYISAEKEIYSSRLKYKLILERTYQFKGKDLSKACEMAKGQIMKDALEELQKKGITSYSELSNAYIQDAQIIKINNELISECKLKALIE